LSKHTEIQNVRYLKTATLTKVLEALPDECVKRLRAERAFQSDVQANEPAPNWITVRNKVVTHLSVNYNALHHGAFSKSGLESILEETGCGDMVISDLDILIPKETRVAERLAELRADPSLSREYFIAQFVKRPLRGEEKEILVYGKDGGVRDACGTDGKNFGFGFTILDLDTILWAQTWREATRKTVCGQYRQAIDGWKDALQNVQGKILKELMRDMFGNGLVATRSYIRKNRKEWILSGIGNW